MLLQPFERVRQFEEGRAIAQGAGFALDHRQIVAPIVNRPTTTVMGTLDDALVLANHLPFGDDDKPIGVNAQADALVGEGGRHAVAGALEADETGRRHWLAVFDKAIERP